MIALVAGLIRNPFVYRLVAVFAWTVAALNILGLLEPVRDALDSFGVVIGGLRVTPLLLIKTTVLLLLTLWAANAASDFLEKRVRGVAELTPSIQVLIGKLIRLLLITFAILVVLSTVGIDFSALAFFSGAVGVGLGFGLQKIVSNLVSGIILLADKSIKPGDVISVGDSFGWVELDGRALYLGGHARRPRVPHPERGFRHPARDQLVLFQRRGAHRGRVRRLLSFRSAPGAARWRVEATKAIERVLSMPAPVCYLKAFGNSSLDFILRFWIRDPHEGIGNMRGQVLLALWDAFKEAGIEIPFPQRDINMRTPVKVVVERDSGAKPR